MYTISLPPRSIEHECFMRATFQVKINPGAPIQIVQNGLTIRHPALPPVPESPPQPLPPLNLEVFTTPFPQLPTQFGNPTQQRLPSIFAEGLYHNLFKRERNESSRKRDIKDEMVMSSLTEKSVTKRDTEKTSKEADSSDGKVSMIKSLGTHRKIHTVSYVN